MEETKNVYIILVGKPKGKRPLEGRRRTWYDTIKMDFKEIGFRDVAQDSVR
jgi:hypothetical protein